MRPGYSIRARLFFGAAIVLLAFLAGAGLAVQRAHADTVRTNHFERLQSTVYLLLARAELDDAGVLVMPASLPEPNLILPQSGLYAGIFNVRRQERWRSLSSLGTQAPFRETGLAPGEWRNETMTQGPGAEFLVTSYAVNWDVGRRSFPLVLSVSVSEDTAELKREVAIFTRTLWTWLGGAALLLLAGQTLLLHWALRPLRQVATEIRRVEHGEQERVEGRYPNEIAGLTENLNTLIQQERVRQVRYREALSYLAHSLKTPLAVLRNALPEREQLPQVVEEQVARMDDIVHHQLARAAAGGSARFAPAVAVAPVFERVRDALAKVYADKGIAITADCPAGLMWRADEGDLFEVIGNLMDNACKWARTRVVARAAREGDRLVIEVDDDGPGFSDTESILQLHVRGDERVPGHGVGLAVVNDIVASHHGELRFTRSELGGGRVIASLSRTSQA